MVRLIESCVRRVCEKALMFVKSHGRIPFFKGDFRRSGLRAHHWYHAQKDDRPSVVFP